MNYPIGIKRVISAAEQNGWAVDVQPHEHFNRENGETSQDVVVHCRKDGRRVSASWIAYGDKPFGYNIGWFAPGAYGIPLRIGHSEAIGLLKADPDAER